MVIFTGLITAIGLGLTRLAPRIIPLASRLATRIPSLLKPFIFPTTTKQKLVQFGLGTAIAVPQVRQFITRKVKEDPGRLLLVTPLAPLQIGREAGKGFKIAEDSAGKSIPSILKDVTVATGIAGLLGAGVVLAPKIIKKVKESRAIVPSIISPIIPRAKSNGKLTVPKTPLPPIPVQPIKAEKPKALSPARITIHNKPNIIIQNQIL